MIIENVMIIELCVLIGGRGINYFAKIAPGPRGWARFGRTVTGDA
jgi:hypothetical protein